MASSVLDQLVQSEPSKWPRFTPLGTWKVVAFAAEILEDAEVPPPGAEPLDGPAPADPPLDPEPPDGPADPEPPDGPADPGAGAAGVDEGADIVGM